MATTIIRSAQATTGASNRQDLRGFATTASPTSTDPIAMGHVACDSDGAALMGRTVHASTVGSAGTTEGQALAAYTKRARLMLQNLSSDTVLIYGFGASVTATTGFKLFPGSVLTLQGEACPADELSVITASDTAAFIAVDW